MAQEERASVGYNTQTPCAYAAPRNSQFHAADQKKNRERVFLQPKAMHHHIIECTDYRLWAAC